MQKNCKARRYNNSMMCGQCGLQWDFKDPEPPPCRPVKTVKNKKKQSIQNNGHCVKTTPEEKPVTQTDWDNLKKSLQD